MDVDWDAKRGRRPGCGAKIGITLAILGMLCFLVGLSLGRLHWLFGTEPPPWENGD